MSDWMDGWDGWDVWLSYTAVTPRASLKSDANNAVVGILWNKHKKTWDEKSHPLFKNHSVTATGEFEDKSQFCGHQVWILIGADCYIIYSKMSQFHLSSALSLTNSVIIDRTKWWRRSRCTTEARRWKQIVLLYKICFKFEGFLEIIKLDVNVLNT